MIHGRAGQRFAPGSLKNWDSPGITGSLQRFGIYDPRVFHTELVDALISGDISILDPGDLPAVIGEEMVINGDFSAGSIGWHYGVWQNSYRAFFKAVNKEFIVDVQTAGDEEWPVQLIKDGISLKEGCRYLLSFEAWSDRPRSFSAGIGGNRQ